MEFALDVASFVFVLTVLSGGVLLAVLVINVLRDRLTLRYPTTTPLPTEALDAAKATLERLKQIYFRSGGDRRNLLGHEVQRLEMRIAYLQARTAEDQYTYYQLCRQREKAWAEWKNVFDRMSSVHGLERRRLRNGVLRAIRRYQNVERLVAEEWRRAIARDELHLEELRTQGVLDLDAQEGPVEFPEEAQGETLAAEAAAAEGEPVPEEEAVEFPLTPEEEAQQAAAQEMNADALDAAIDEAVAEAEAEGGPEAPGSPEAPPPGEATPDRVTTGLAPWGEPPLADLDQARMADPEAIKAGVRYRDPTLSVETLPGGRLSGTDLSRSVFAGVHFVGVHRYVRCAFTGADLRRIRLARAAAPHQFVECDLRGVSFQESLLEYVLFLRCDLSDSAWPGARLTGVKFADCRLEGADWDGVDLSRAVFAGSSLESADWSAAARPPHDTGQPAPAPGQPPPGAHVPGQPPPGAHAPGDPPPGANRPPPAGAEAPPATPPDPPGRPPSEEDPP